MIRIVRISLVALVCSVSLKATAQEATMYFMNSLPQVSYSNPALQPRYKFSLGLPGSSVFAQASSNGLKYKDVATEQGDTLVSDLDRLRKAAQNKNYVTAAAQADLFRLSLKVNARMYFTWNITAKSYSRVMAPKDLLDIFADEEASLTKSFSMSPQVEALAYLESGWGASYVVNKKLTVGARFKLLKGFANATTKSAQIDYSINNTEVSARADVDLRTSGIQQWDDDDFEIEDNWESYKKNTGYAFDLGGTYQVNDRLTVGASLLDIGSITWKNNPYGYRLDPAKANASFSALNLEALLNGDEEYNEEALDTIEQNFEFEEGAIASYRSALPAKIYLSGSYRLKKSLMAGVLLFAETFQGRISPGASASLHKEFGRRLSTSLSYTVTHRSYNNLGAGISLNFAPLQLYVVGDNILRAPIALLADGDVDSYLNSSKFMNVRVGLNFVFGWDKTQERLPASK